MSASPDNMKIETKDGMVDKADLVKITDVVEDDDKLVTYVRYFPAAAMVRQDCYLSVKKPLAMDGKVQIVPAPPNADTQ